METNEQSYIYFEEITPEDLEYIDSCKIRAQNDSEYWESLKNLMSQGKIEYNSELLDDNSSVNNSEISEEFNDEEQEETTLETIKSLLEYQTKMLENMNYAFDDLTEKCIILSKYCAKLAKRLKKYGGNNSHLDLEGIVNTPEQNQQINTDYEQVPEMDSESEQTITEIDIELEN